MLWFDDLEVGQRRLIGTYAIPRDEAIEFARRWEPQPHHLEEAAAETSLFGGLTVCSLYLFAVCTRLFFEQDDGCIARPASAARSCTTWRRHQSVC